MQAMFEIFLAFSVLRGVLTTYTSEGLGVLGSGNPVMWQSRIDWLQSFVFPKYFYKEAFYMNVRKRSMYVKNGRNINRPKYGHLCPEA